MAELLIANRKSVLAVCCLVLFLSAMALAFNVRTRKEASPSTSRQEKAEVLKQIEGWPEQPLRVLGNDGCPLRIIQARVKEIPGALFTKLTGKTTDLDTVSSVPEVSLVNTSGRAVKKFFLFVRNPEAHFTRGVGRSVTLKPGETYVVERKYFAAPEKATAMDENGQAHETLIEPGLDSEKLWLNKGARSDLYVAVIRVEYEDGSSWTVEEGGEVR